MEQFSQFLAVIPTLRRTRNSQLKHQIFDDLFGGNCTVSDLSFTSADVFGFPPGSIFDLSYAAQDGIIGNVAIKESDEWDEKQIVVRVSYGASTAELFDSMSALILLNETAMVGSAAFFLRGVTPEAKKKLLRGNCARADVEIVYPRTRPGTGRLMVDILNGDISAEFDRHLGSKPATFDELVLKSMNGDIQLEHVPVLKNLTMFTANGHIYGSVRTGSVLGVSVVNGPIDLAVDTVPIPGADKHWNAMGLDANLLTINGHITLDISPSFEGHFELETAVGRPSVVAKDPINYVTKTATNLKGWVSADGQEPVTVLPKLAMFAANGNVKVKVSKE
ncbi:hypothetical protein BG004_006293 [Podila humilis]|nr:hypothetical protein BG004_006293 [Podila humilis]